MSKRDEKPTDGSNLLKVIEAIAISPKDAKDLVHSLRKTCGSRRKKSETEEQFNARVADKVGNRIIERYSRFAATSGGLSSLPGVLPGIGTIASIGGALGDVAACLKFQVDMCMCLAETYNHDLRDEEARHLSFILAVGGSLEQLGEKGAGKLASKAGVKMVRRYLQGAVLETIKQLFRRFGLVFSRKALERAIPLGVGVVLGVGGNYALTKYVGKTAKGWFVAERETSDDNTDAV